MAQESQRPENDDELPSLASQSDDDIPSLRSHSSESDDDLPSLLSHFSDDDDVYDDWFRHREAHRIAHEKEKKREIRGSFEAFPTFLEYNTLRFMKYNARGSLHIHDVRTHIRQNAHCAPQPCTSTKSSTSSRVMSDPERSLGFAPLDI